MEKVADSITQFLYDKFRSNETNDRNFALARLYKTHPYIMLPSDLQDITKETLSQKSDINNLQCLTLLASKGDNDAWNSRKTSKGHKVIPLLSENFVESLPIISGLVKAFGLKISDIISPDTSIQIEKQSETYNIFYVPEAKGSALIPVQQDFVIPYGIRSVIDFGGVLPSKNVYVIK